jgi:hypothetical protein
MSHPKGWCQWIGVVSSWLPNLSWSQAKGLGEYSYGMVMTRRSGLSFIADFLGELKGEATNTVRQRLREWYYDAPDKAGRNRQGAAILNFERKSEDKGQLPEKLRSSPEKGQCLLPVRV